MCSQLLTARNRISLISVATLLTGIAMATSCSPTPVRSNTEGTQEVASKPKETPVPLVPTTENKGSRCEARNYILSGNESVQDTIECYKLQKQLAEAVAHNNLLGIKEALKYGAHPDGIIDDGYSALHSAAAGGHVEAVRLLLDNGADVNWGDFVSGTPLIVAAGGGYAEVVKVLLARNANVCIVADGGTALDIAKKQSHREIVDLVVSAGGEKCK